MTQLKRKLTELKDRTKDVIQNATQRDKEITYKEISKYGSLDSEMMMTAASQIFNSKFPHEKEKPESKTKTPWTIFITKVGEQDILITPQIQAGRNKLPPVIRPTCSQYVYGRKQRGAMRYSNLKVASRYSLESTTGQTEQ